MKEEKREKMKQVVKLENICIQKKSRKEENSMHE